MGEPSSVWFLGLLLLVPIAAWVLLRADRRSSIRFSMADAAGQLEPTWRQRTAWIPTALRLLGLGLLILALARPREGLTQRVAETEGIAIELVVDRSGSMDHDDYVLNGRWVTRLDAVQATALQFIIGDDDLPGRPHDSIGLVAFARYAETLSPPTLDHEFSLAHLDEMRVVSGPRQDGTAIGDGLGLAVANLQELDRETDESAAGTPVEKVVILLTDGENNAGEVSPRQAAQLAAMCGVRVYVISVQPRGADQSAVGDEEQATEDLRQIAAITGGKFFAASDVESLKTIYREIDQLERSPLPERHYTDYREWAIESFRWGPFAFPPLALAALVLLSIEVVARRTVYARCP